MLLVPPGPVPLTGTRSCPQADAQYDKFVQQLTAAAEGKVGEVFFILVDPPSNSHALNFFGLKEADTPAFVLQNENDKYIAKKALPKHLTKFIKDYEVGHCRLTLLSSPRLQRERDPARRLASWRRLSSLRTLRRTTAAL